VLYIEIGLGFPLYVHFWLNILVPPNKMHRSSIISRPNKTFASSIRYYGQKEGSTNHSSKNHHLKMQLEPKNY